MKKRVTLFLSCLFISIGLIFAQTTVPSNGTVVDETGEPLIGVSVAVKGTTTGTITDIDGNFTLNVPSNSSVLVFSLVGMSPAEHKASTNMRITMQQDSQILDEVMVVAYGTASKKSFTGSASVVKADAISKIQSSSVTSALEGRSAGVQIVSSTGQPGENPTVRIRGIGSINAGKAPLYIVDGATYDGPISALNSADIESMTVLKDAAANSLYGARGSNGVILIVTKRGTRSNKVGISVDAKWGVNSRGVPDYDMITDRGTFYEQTWKAQYNKLYDAYVGREKNPLSPKDAHTQSIADLAGNGSNSLSAILGGYNNYNVPWSKLIDNNGKINPDARLLYKDDWSDALFSSELRQEYNIGISGADEKQSYYIGIGYLDDKSYAKGSGFERYSGRLRFDKNLTTWLKTGVSLSYGHTIQNYPTTSGTSYVNYFQWTRQIAPIYPVYLRDPDTGEVIKDKNGDKIYDYGDRKDYGYSRPYGARSNPAGVLNYDINKITLDNVTGSVFFEANILDGLSARVAMDVNNTAKNGSYLTNPLYGDAKANNGYVEKQNKKWFSYTTSFFLNYKKELVDKLNFDAMAGAESYKKEYSYEYAMKKGLAVSNVPEFNNAVVMSDMDSYTQKYSVVGYLARINLDYNSKYYLSASYRRDGSSRFHPDNRWGNFGSLGLSWRVTREDFMTSVTWLDELKLKGSIGSQGNDDLHYPYPNENKENYIPYKDQYAVSNIDDKVAIKQNYLGNKNISWERSTNLNLGFESRLFNRLNFNFEYFYKKTTDMLFYKPIAVSNGISEMPSNLGEMKNAGIEIEMDVDIIRNRDLKWNIGINMTHFKNKILKLPAENKEKGIFYEGYGYTKLMEGGSIYDIYLPEFAGLNDKGQATFNMYDEDGNLTGTTTVNSLAYDNNSRRKVGNALPDLTGGITTSLEWKGFDFSAVFSYQLGGDVYDEVYAGTMQMSEAGRGMHKDLLKAWTPENTNTTVARFVMGYKENHKPSDLYLTSASYFNIRNITVGYTLPKSLTKKISMDGVRFYMAGDNLALLSKRKGLDPRQYDYGKSSYNYSPIRTISLGLNITL